jgi:hypothetical protein
VSSEQAQLFEPQGYLLSVPGKSSIVMTDDTRPCTVDYDSVNAR